MTSFYSVLSARYHMRSTSRSELYMNHAAVGGADAPLEMGYYFWLLDDGRHVIAVDSGFSAAQSVHRNRPYSRTPNDLLGAAGIDPKRVETLVLTHAHYDHAGNLDLYPNARIVMSTAERDFWLSPSASRLQFRFLADPAFEDSLRGAMGQGRVETFDDVIAFDGVTVERVGGHTPGQCIVHVPVENGTLVLASDAAHLSEQLELDALFTFVADVPDSYRALDRLKELTRHPDVVGVVHGHDAELPAVFEAMAEPGLDRVGPWPHPARA